MDAKQFLKQAHANGHRGPLMLKRFAIYKNDRREKPADRITMDVLNEAIGLEADEDAGQGRLV